MSYENITKLRRKTINGIPLKGKTPDELRDLLILHSHGLGESLLKKYGTNRRLRMLLPTAGDYQSLVHQACLKTIDVYDYYLWKKEGDLEAKERIKKWRNGHGQKFVPKGKLNFKHLGHLYAYMFLTAENYVKMEWESLLLVKRYGMEVYGSQLKTGDERFKSSTWEAIIGSADNTQSEDAIFHKEIMAKLPNDRILRRRGSYLTYQELYVLRFIEDYTNEEIAEKLNYSESPVAIYSKRLNIMLASILKEREVA